MLKVVFIGDRSKRSYFSNLYAIFKIWQIVQISLTIGLLFTTVLFSQDKPMKWGEVPQADLEMTKFPQDSNAAAVILGDYGEVYFDDDVNMVFTRHRRIKILSAAGYEWGTHSIDYFAEARHQWVSDLEGQTLKLAPDGSMRIDKLDKNAIFDEEVNNGARRIRFTLPALAPGVVVEYRYMVRWSRGFSGNLHDWAFQASEPTRWSEFRAAIPSDMQFLDIRFVMVKENIPALAIEESTSEISPITLNVYRYDPSYQSSIGQRPLRKTKIYEQMMFKRQRWAMKNVPALRQEPFITTLDDYRARLNFQIAEINSIGEQPFKFMQTWEKVAEELMDSPGFGGQLARNGDWRKQAEALTTNLDDPTQKMRAIFDYVRATMKWDGSHSIFAGDLSKAFQARRGNAAEIALMLASMLRAAGLEAHPVLISTRDNGKVIQVYSLLRQFNHVLTYVKAGEREHLLDATDPLRPYNMLPVEALTDAGWLVKKKTPQWIDIANPESFDAKAAVSAKLEANGTISGWMESSHHGYSALLVRRALRDKKEEEYIREEWLNHLTSAELDSFRISRKDSISAPLATKVFFSVADYAQIAGDNLYFNPVVFARREENPFKQPERTFPVDFAYGSKQNYTMNLMLPEGYAVAELPKNISFTLANGDAQFRRLAQVEESNLQIVSQLVIRKPSFAPEEYQALREFYDRVVAAHAEVIALKRETASGAAKK